jgi:hypothetical protein
MKLCIFKPLTLTFGLLFGLNVFAAGDVVDKGIHTYFDSHGVAKNFTQKSYDNLLLLCEKLVVDIKKDIESVDDKDDKKDLKKKKQFLDYALLGIEEAKEQSISPSMRRFAFNRAKRIIYSLRSEDLLGRNMNVKEVVNLLRRVDTTLPYVKPSKRKSKLGKKKANKEAQNLVDPKAPQSIMSAREISKLNTIEISNLDIHNDHPGWLSEEEMKKRKVNGYTAIENWAEKEMQKRLRKKHPEVALDYSLSAARKVLFFDKIKNSATSPKINTKDAFGEKWKLKWGSEVHTEPINNRLYTLIGGRFTDLVYSNQSGINGTVLILGKSDKEDCSKISTYKHLQHCLLVSTYNFDITPYVIKKGTITKFNIEKVLRNLPAVTLKKYSKKKLIGRTYVAFKESMVEFKSKALINKAGPTPGSFFGPLEDRVSRGLLLFNIFIWNLDAKDENNRTVMVKNFDGEKWSYVEYMHDMGASLGAPGESGKVNALKTGNGFLRVTSNPVAGFGFLKFPFLTPRVATTQFMLYRPKAWDKTTFADSRWMAKKIAGITKKQFDSILSKVNWPEYMRDLMVWKLMKRRNHIAKIYGVSDLLDIKKLAPLDVSFDLTTPLAREVVARQTKLTRSEIESVMKSEGLIDGPDGVTVYIDKVMDYKGQLYPCQESVIASLLFDNYHPAGLERRIRRSEDNVALPECQFNDFSLDM